MSVVTTGWVVKKRWKTSRLDPKKIDQRITTAHEKVVSDVFMSKNAADTFCALAKKYPPKPARDEESVEFYVTDNLTEDGLPANI